MTNQHPDPNVEREVRPVLRVGLWTTTLTLAAALLVTLSGAERAAASLLTAGLALLVAMPVVNVLVAVVDEWRLRDWRFVAAATLVLLMLLYSVVRALV